MVDVNGADQLNNIEVARQNAAKIADVVSSFAPTNSVSRALPLPNFVSNAFGLGNTAVGNKISGTLQTNSNIAAFNSYRSAAIEAMRAMAGSKGLRINSAEIKLAQDNDIPTITDTVSVANQKLDNLRSQLASWENTLVQPPVKQISYQGKTYNVDQQGNMTPAN